MNTLDTLEYSNSHLTLRTKQTKSKVAATINIYIMGRGINHYTNSKQSKSTILYRFKQILKDTKTAVEVMRQINHFATRKCHILTFANLIKSNYHSSNFPPVDAS